MLGIFGAEVFRIFGRFGSLGFRSAMVGALDFQQGKSFLLLVARVGLLKAVKAPPRVGGILGFRVFSFMGFNGRAVVTRWALPQNSE